MTGNIMGFFSWKTADTKESIGNTSSTNSHSKKHGYIYLLQPNAPAICEVSYEGYGVFAGVHAYCWLGSKNITEPQFMRLIDEAFNNRIKSDIKAITEQLNYEGMFSIPDEGRDFLETKKAQCENLLFYSLGEISELKKGLYLLLETGDFSEKSYELLQKDMKKPIDIGYAFLFELLRNWGVQMESEKGLLFPVKLSFNKQAKYADFPASEWCDVQGYFY